MTFSGTGTLYFSSDAGWKEYMSSIQKVVIAPGITRIGDEAFYNSEFPEVSISDTVTSIGNQAFRWSKLTSLTIPNSVTKIEGWAFEGCSQLQSVTIPNSVTYIGDKAFQSCRRLVDLTLPNPLPELGDRAFNTVPGYTKGTLVEGENIISTPASIDHYDYYKFTPKKSGFYYTRTGEASAETMSVDSSPIFMSVDIGDPANASFYDSKGEIVQIAGYIGSIPFYQLSAGKQYYVNVGLNTSSYTGSKITLAILRKQENATITVGAGNSITKTLGAAAFSLKAKTTGDGKLTYQSSNTKVATVDKNGKVTLKGTGTVKITITAAETANYKKVTKTVTITVKSPKAPTLSKVSNVKGKKLKVTWKKVSGVTGYQIQYCTNKSFKKPTSKKAPGASRTSATYKGLKKKKKYYVRIRTYKTIGKKDYYSGWSKVKNITINK